MQTEIKVKHLADLKLPTNCNQLAAVRANGEWIVNYIAPVTAAPTPTPRVA